MGRPAEAELPRIGRGARAADVDLENAGRVQQLTLEIHCGDVALELSAGELPSVRGAARDGDRESAQDRFELALEGDVGRGRIAQGAGEGPGRGGTGAARERHAADPFDLLQPRLQVLRLHALLGGDAGVAVPQDAARLAGAERELLHRVVLHLGRGLRHAREVRRAVGVEEVGRLVVGQAIQVLEHARVVARRDAADERLHRVPLGEREEIAGVVLARAVEQAHHPRIGARAAAGDRGVVLGDAAQRVDRLERRVDVGGGHAL